MRRSVVLALLTAAAALGARRAAAQEVVLSGPLAGACAARADTFSVPAPIETTYWVAGGVVAGDATSATAGGGAELTTAALGRGAPPRGYGPAGEPGNLAQARRGPLELRLGPWAQAAVRGAGALVEGGNTVHLGAVDDRLTRASSLLMFDFRLGGGYGAFAAGHSAYLTAAVAWGFRTVFDRHSVGLPCDPEPPPPQVADATAIRLVLDVRRATELPATEIGITLEVTPSAVFLPWRTDEKRERAPSAWSNPACTR